MPLDLGVDAEALDVGTTIPDAIVASRLDDGVWTDLTGSRPRRSPAWSHVANDWLDAVKTRREETIRRLASGSDEEARKWIRARMAEMPQPFSKTEDALLEHVLACRRELDALSRRVTWWYRLVAEPVFLGDDEAAPSTRRTPPTDCGVLLDGAWLDRTHLDWRVRRTAWDRITVDWVAAVPVDRSEVRRLAALPESTARQLLSGLRGRVLHGEIDALLSTADGLRVEQRSLSEARPTAWYHLLTGCAQAHLTDGIEDALDAAWAAMLDQQQGIRRGLGPALALDDLPAATSEETRFLLVSRCGSGCLMPAGADCPVHPQGGRWSGSLPLCWLHAGQAGRNWDSDAHGPAGACDECLASALYPTAWERVLGPAIDDDDEAGVALKEPLADFESERA